jgi:hypothetical protein
MKLIHFFSFIILISLNFSCKGQSKIIKGSVYIKLIDLGSLYKVDKEKINNLRKQVGSFDETKSNESEKLFYTYYKALFEANLIDKPCTLIKEENGTFKRVFFPLKEYHKIENLILNLDKNNEKINLILDVKKVNDDIYFANKIISFDKTKGKTEWKK